MFVMSSVVDIQKNHLIIKTVIWAHKTKWKLMDKKRITIYTQNLYLSGQGTKIPLVLSSLQMKSRKDE